jgi:hypothetical protein
MRFWLKAIVDFFGGLFSATVEDDLGTSRPEAAPASPGETKTHAPTYVPTGRYLLRDEHDVPYTLTDLNRAVVEICGGRPFSKAGASRIRKAFQQYADERIK